MGSLPQDDYFSPIFHHLSILQEVLQASTTADFLVRSYYRSFNGFAAKLTDEERRKLAGMDRVVSVFPSRALQLHTTRSWDFMGFTDAVKRNPIVESDVIVGVFDSGIWPESESFNDEGFGPPPVKWKGTCRGGKNFTCNNKIIGAQYFPPDEANSARDFDGHGSHTASTAAGNKVADVSFYGLAQGNARGGVPSARIAAYKVCSDGASCSDVDILSAFDQAIADGVDIISISLGANSARDFAEDSIAIGAFHAMVKGILTVNSAGNSGPTPSTVSSVAPWMLSVAASTTDRQIIDRVILGNGTVLVGNSINSFTLDGTKFPLINGGDASTNIDMKGTTNCCDGCLDSELARGKIVVCLQPEDTSEALRAGAMGSIVRNIENNVVPFPTSGLSYQDFLSLDTYMISTENPQATILSSEVITDAAAPTVDSFSSRGPNNIAPEILKPDISAPGVDILAAFSPLASPSGTSEDKRSVKYSILSGTSMSCPHATGAAAYVKTFHPDWSPSAIKSALMTTASAMDASRHPSHEFAYGAGHINPGSAVHPGLVYEAFEDDYVSMLCSMGYDSKKVEAIAGSSFTCSGDVNASPKDLNYPSMVVHVEPGKPFTVELKREVKNVGLGNSRYDSKVVTSDDGVSVTVEPTSLFFETSREKKSFVVSVSGGGLPESSMASASLVWFDGAHSVTSPIVVYTNKGPDTEFPI
ncbi:subtilisin-like protease SBT4.3 isoform X2 [Cornus florida]|uniref:subtilisin-like protease SBT4.3 isoform X2 n=1 Tax=Cornus florida TaxID=4283 RepID=UPI0028966288|nr:subtilisin-like protease SBT4.3 isoform X2 [Cornus florida]